MYIIRLWGIKIKLNLLFLVVMTIFAYLRLLDRALVTFGAVFLHELAHVMVAKNNGIDIEEVELLPFGGVAKYNDLLELAPGIEIKTALAGPFCNLFLATVMVICLRHGLVSVNWGLFFIKTNLAIAFFNLIPALPLDGGRVFRAIMVRQLGFREATSLAIKISKYLSIVITGAALIGIYLGFFNILLLIIAFFIYFAASKENRQSIYVLMRYLAKKKSKLKEEEVLKNQEYVVMETASIKNIIEKFTPKTFHTIIVVDADLNVRGTLTEEEIIRGMLDLGLNTEIKELL